MSGIKHQSGEGGRGGGETDREREFYNHLKDSHSNIINNLREILERSPISQLLLGHKQSPQTEIPRD